MKKILIMLALGVMVSGASYAQDGLKKERKQRTEFQGKKEKKSPEERASKRTQKMSQQLDLNKSQTDRLQALNLRHAQQMQANITPGERGQKRGADMKAHRAQWEAELKDILTEKQYAQYEAERPQIRDRSAGNKQERGKELPKRKEARAQQRS